MGKARRLATRARPLVQRTRRESVHAAHVRRPGRTPPWTPDTRTRSTETRARHRTSDLAHRSHRLRRHGRARPPAGGRPRGPLPHPRVRRRRGRLAPARRPAPRAGARDRPRRRHRGRPDRPPPGARRAPRRDRRGRGDRHPQRSLGRLRPPDRGSARDQRRGHPPSPRLRGRRARPAARGLRVDRLRRRRPARHGLRGRSRDRDLPQLLRALQARGRGRRALQRPAVDDRAPEHHRRREHHRLDGVLQRHLRPAAGLRRRRFHGASRAPALAGRRRPGRLRRRRGRRPRAPPRGGRRDLPPDRRLACLERSGRSWR